MQVPQTDILTTQRLGRIFSSTAATYKFFWFIAILQMHAKGGELRLNVWEIVTRMVALAWYPIHYFRLSFGKNDSLFQIVNELQKLTGLPIDANVDAITDALQQKLGEREVKQKLNTLTLNVPYRFLSPWINTSDNREMVQRSQTLENQCLYAIYKEGNTFIIELNAAWDSYLHQHYAILTDFAYWNLTLFLQARNPNVPAIPNKLIRPEQRNSLQRQHRYWDAVMTLSPEPLRCIYTDNTLQPQAYDLDHFIPWSFVSHDLNWNLIPSDGSINSSKNNRLPELDIYLPRLADVQQRSLKTILHAGRRFEVLEDYLSLGYGLQELAEMSSERFLEVWQHTFNPISQIAQNMGFETWRY